MKSTRAIAPEVSVVLAVRNVEDSVGFSVKRVAHHLRSLNVPFEILAINDGCWDTSLAVLRLLSAELPELRVIEKDLSSRAFVRGAAEARGAMVILMDASSVPSSLAPLGWSLSRLAQGTDAVVVRARYVAARRLPALSAIARSRGRADLFERAFEREARDLRIEVVGTARRSSTVATAASAAGRLLGPVWRLLAA
jgi:hypothetical protein